MYYKGWKKECFIIHRALLGTIEIFFGIVMEQYNGAFHIWLSQVRILTINEKIKQSKCIKVNIDTSQESLGHKITISQNEKIPYMVIIRDKDVKNNTIFNKNRKNQF